MHCNDVNLIIGGISIIIIKLLLRVIRTPKTKINIENIINKLVIVKLDHKSIPTYRDSDSYKHMRKGNINSRLSDSYKHI